MKTCNYNNQRCGEPATEVVEIYVKTDIMGNEIYRSEKVCSECYIWHREIQNETEILSWGVE